MDVYSLWTILQLKPYNVFGLIPVHSHSFIKMDVFQPQKQITSCNNVDPRTGRAGERGKQLPLHRENTFHHTKHWCNSQRIFLLSWSERRSCFLLTWTFRHCKIALLMHCRKQRQEQETESSGTTALALGSRWENQWLESPNTKVRNDSLIPLPMTLPYSGFLSQANIFSSFTFVRLCEKTWSANLTHGLSHIPPSGEVPCNTWHCSGMCK